MKTAAIDPSIVSQMPRVGFWWSEDEPNLPHPKELVDDDWDEEERQKVINYLETALVMPSSHCGLSWCRMCLLNKHPDDIGTQDLTDGTWVFPEGFVHYLRKHNVKPPEEFLRHVRENNYVVPEIEPIPAPEPKP